MYGGVKLLFDFDAQVAKDLGVNEAIIFQYVARQCYPSFKLEMPRKDYAECFPFFTERQIGYALKNLTERGILDCTSGYMQYRSNVYSLTELGKSYYSSCVNNKKFTVDVKSQKLVSPRVTSKKDKTAKANSFIKNCENLCKSFEFSKDVMSKLSAYFIYLAEENVLLPQKSIKQQLLMLNELEDSKKIIAIDNTIAHGWKSLVYVINNIKQNPWMYVSASDAIKDENVVDTGEHIF